MMGDEDVAFCLKLMMSKGDGEKIPFVLKIDRPKPVEDKSYNYVGFSRIENGVVQEYMRIFGEGSFHAVCMGIFMVRSEIDRLSRRYKFWRRVEVEDGDGCCEVGVDDLFPYTRAGLREKV